MSSVSLNVELLVTDVNLELGPFFDSQAVPSCERDGNPVPKFSINPKAKPVYWVNSSSFRSDGGGGGKYTRSKSPNMFNRRTIEVSTPAVSKQSAQSQKLPQRARTASMPGENRKVTGKSFVLSTGLIGTDYSFADDQPVALIFMHSVTKIRSVDFQRINIHQVARKAH